MFKKNSKSLMAIFLAICFIFFAGYSYSADVHTVISDEPIAVIDGDTGIEYWTPFDPIKGFAVATWRDRTTDAFFQAEVKIKAKDEELKYRFECAAPSHCDSYSIHGLWNIYRDGKPVCTSCIGRAYSLSLPVGEYFKLYVGDPFDYAEKWHLSGYISFRADR